MEVRLGAEAHGADAAEDVADSHTIPGRYLVSRLCRAAVFLKKPGGSSRVLELFRRLFKYF